MTRARTRPPRLPALGTLPVAATVTTAVLALYMLVVAIGNITDYHTNQAFVQHVLAMDTTFKDPDLMWRSITNPVLQTIVYLGVIAWEVLTAAMLIWAVARWWGALRTRSFESARRAATLGFLMIIMLFAGGFITIGGEWFAMWQSKQWNGLQPALQNTILASFALVLTQLPSGHWEPASPELDPTLAGNR